MSLKRRNLILSPKFTTSDMRVELQMRFKSRIRSNRATLLGKFRPGFDQTLVEDTLKDMLFEDIDALNEIDSKEFKCTDLDINKEIEILAEIEKELVDEELKWLVSEYDKASGNLDTEYIDSFDEVICPLCLKSPLTLSVDSDAKHISCALCCMKIRTDKSVLQLKDYILKILSEHSSKCQDNPQFSVIPDVNDNHLYVICSLCSFMAVIL